MYFIDRLCILSILMAVQPYLNIAVMRAQYLCQGKVVRKSRKLKRRNFMNYIIFDLEWNQSPLGKEQEEKMLPFEIVEIGAVKLNKNKEEISRFHETIKPVVYHAFHKKTKEIIHLDMAGLRYARTFPEVIDSFLRWCGHSPKYCTWGPGDLLELQRNMRYHQIPDKLPKPLFFYDIQKIFSIVYEDRKTRRSLEFAVDALKIPKVMEFHNALSDAHYTAEVLKTMESNQILKNSSIDYFRPPKLRKEEIYKVYDTYSKFVSKEFSSKTEAMDDKKVTLTKCYICGRAAKKKIHWFSNGGRNYFCLAYCESHGWLRGKVRMKKVENGGFFCVKTLKLVSPQDAQAVQDKRIALRLKNQIRRHN